jgi:hypothetical protein
VAEVQHLRNDAKPASGEQSAPGKGAKQGTSKFTPAVTTSTLGTGLPGARGLGRHGAVHPHGKPSSSPAKSDNAATGKGIAGTQHGATGTDGAPGQLKKTGTLHGKAHARGQVKHSRPITPKPQRITPLRPVKPVAPVQPSTPTVEEQPTATVPTTADDSATTGNGQSKQ